MVIAVGIAWALLITTVAIIWLYPPIQIYRDDRATASVRTRWAICSFLSGPMYLLVSVSVSRSNPEVIGFLRLGGPVDTAALVIGAGLALPYLALVCFRVAWKLEPNRTLEGDAKVPPN
jgi:hypothetical protein